MKMDCNVTRDLIPLMIDGVASAESMRLVQQHLDECAPCAEYYNGMKSTLELNTQRNDEERQAFDKAARHLRSRRRWRIWRNVLIGMLIGALLVTGAFAGWRYLTQDCNTLVYYGEYGVFLSRLSDGRVAVNVDFRGSDSYMLIDVEERSEEGNAILYVCAKRPFLRRSMSIPMSNYSCLTLSSDDVERYTEIREGTAEEYCVVWQKGITIPAASEEMETYFTLEEQIQFFPLRETADGKALAMSRDDERRLAELQWALSDAREAVPEWQ